MKKFTLFAIFCSCAIAQIGLDNKYATQSATSQSSLTYSFSVGTGLTHSKLVVGVAYENVSRSVSSITYAGTSLTKILKETDGSHNAICELWYLDSPASGSNTVAITMDGNVGSNSVIASGVMSFSGMAAGADVAHVGSPSTGSHSSHSDSVNTTNDNAWIVDVLVENAGSTAATASGSQTNVITSTTASNGSIGMSTLGPVSPAALTSVGWSFTSTSNASMHIAASFAPFVAAPTTWYLSPSGSDSTGNGTSGNPYKSVSKGITVASTGDTIVLKDGVYDDSVTYGGGSTSGWLIWLDKAGSSGSPYTMKAEHPGQAILDCGNVINSSQTGCLGYIQFYPNPAFWIFDGLVFARSYDIMILANNGVAHDITFNNCQFFQVGEHSSTIMTGMDAVFTNSNQYNFTFTGNQFHDIGRTGGMYLANDHALYLHSSGTVISGNYFYGHISGWGVQTADGFDGSISGNSFANTQTANSGQIMLWGTDGAITVSDNVFSSPSGGYAINTTGFTPSSCTISSNAVFAGTMGTVSSCTFSNNAVINP